MIPVVKRVSDWFAERSVRGMLTRMVGAWLVVGLPVIAARIWWSVTVAIVVFVGTVSAYVTFAVRYMRRHSPPA
jgi:fatty acid desaturase